MVKSTNVDINKLMTLSRDSSKAARRRLFENMGGLFLDEDDRLSEQERAHVENFLSLSVVGGHVSIKHKLEMIAKQLEVDEFIFTNDVFDSEKRHRALEILMEIKH